MKKNRQIEKIDNVVVEVPAARVQEIKVNKPEPLMEFIKDNFVSIVFVLGIILVIYKLLTN